MVDNVPQPPRFTGDTRKDLDAVGDWLTQFARSQNGTNQAAADRVPTTDEVAGTGAVMFTDMQDFAEADPNKPATQGSTKTYIDNGVVTCIAIAASDEESPIDAGTGKTTFHMPYAFELTDGEGATILPFAGLTIAQASGNIFTVDINKNGASILSTKITIDNTEETSLDPATPAVLAASPTVFAKGDKVTVDVDQIGNGTATGLKVYLIGRKLST